MLIMTKTEEIEELRKTDIRYQLSKDNWYILKGLVSIDREERDEAGQLFINLVSDCVEAALKKKSNLSFLETSPGEQVTTKQVASSADITLKDISELNIEEIEKTIERYAYSFVSYFKGEEATYTYIGNFVDPYLHRQMRFGWYGWMEIVDK